MQAIHGDSAWLVEVYDGPDAWVLAILNKQVATNAGGTGTTICVAGLLKKVTKPSKVLWKHYVPTASGTAAVYIRRRNLTAIGNTTPDGFTSHEHLDNLGLIHMNGRGSAVAGSARPAIPESNPVAATIDALPGLENRS